MRLLCGMLHAQDLPARTPLPGVSRAPPAKPVAGGVLDRALALQKRRHSARSAFTPGPFEQKEAARGHIVGIVERVQFDTGLRTIQQI